MKLDRRWVSQDSIADNAIALYIVYIADWVTRLPSIYTLKSSLCKAKSCEFLQKYSKILKLVFMVSISIG